MIGLGPFDLFAEIGRGGAGQVWSAVHRDQHQPVAVKFLSPQRASHPTFRAVFHNEVRAVAALNHPAIVRVFDYGEVPARVAAASEGRIALGSPYLIMELVRGGTLDDVAGKLHWGELRAVLVSLLDALAHAHARGVIHRDIKPGNVLLALKDDAHDGPRIAVKLTDFGLAHAFHAAGAPSERAAEGGTPAYMAPEQIQRRSYEFGPWTDLYAFGCVAWHLASGHPPFGASRAQSRRMSSKTVLPALEPALPVADGFEAWVRTLMTAAPEQRFQCAADASHALLGLTAPAAQALAFQARPKADDDVTTLIATAFLTEVTGSVTEQIDDEPTSDVGPIVRDPPSPRSRRRRSPRTGGDPSPDRCRSSTAPVSVSTGCARCRSSAARASARGSGGSSRRCAARARLASHSSTERRVSARAGSRNGSRGARRRSVRRR